jgi:phenylalanyl-tRNA synthetase beta chain
MKLSYNWLKDYIDINDAEINQIVESLTMRAFEVESIEKLGDKLEGKIVLGQILEIQKHPNADKLQITKTWIGNLEDASRDIQQIVCGASNIAVGQKIPVACIGSKVVSRKDGTSLEIKNSNIRGVDSFGMLCSCDELGFSEAESQAIRAKQGDGIYILEDPNRPEINFAQGFKVGDDIRRVLNLESDYVLEVGARSNRGDALSVIGQAREISALTHKKLKVPDPIKISSLNTEIIFDPSIKSFKPEIESENDCSVFLTIAIQDLETRPSPEWMKKRLESVGFNSINNLVDISNYVLLEFGQPLHFYDRAKLSGSKLLARRAQEKEKIRTLDDKELDLSDINLLIADEEQAQCLAGVMGGWDSQIDENTSSIIIEAAAFNSAVVRKSARAAGIESESKKRFERGVDKSKTEQALLRAVELLSKYAHRAGSKIKVGELLKAGSSEEIRVKVSLRLSSVKRHLGISLDKNLLVEILESLEIELVDENEELLSFAIPSFRQKDIRREIDLIEEIGRLYGLDKIPLSPPLNIHVMPNSEKHEIEEFIRRSCISNGFNEVLLSSLVGKSITEITDQEDIGELRIEMENPLSKDHRTLRDSLLGALIQAASRNFAHEKSEDIKLFELGKIYHKKHKDSSTRDECIETNKFAVIYIPRNQDWTLSKTNLEELEFFKFKKLISDIFPRSKFQALSKNLRFLHTGISAEVFDAKKSVGVFGKIHPRKANEFKIPEETYLLEFLYPRVIKRKTFKDIVNTPIVERDITIDIEGGLASESIIEIINKHAAPDLSSVKLVALFKPETSSALSSLSYRLRWQSSEKSLEGQEIDSRIIELKRLLEKELGVKFRG